MCLSTSRRATASNGDSQLHSPFVQELLDPTHGIFASHMPLQRGIENACTRMREKLLQQLVTMSLERIPPDFCPDQNAQDFHLLQPMGRGGGSTSHEDEDIKTDSFAVGQKRPRLPSDNAGYLSLQRFNTGMYVAISPYFKNKT